MEVMVEDGTSVHGSVAPPSVHSEHKSQKASVSVASVTADHLQPSIFPDIAGMSFNTDKAEKNSNVVFMTTLDRELFPVKMPQNRFGNEIVPLRGAPHRGPGCYENETKTNFWYDIEHKINSTKGYTLGARTAPRFRKEDVYQTPAPPTYQTNCTDLHEFDTSKKPFLVGSDRFPVYRRDITEVLPGPGVYEHSIPRNRKVQWHQSFGGSPVMMPTIQVRSTIDSNTSKLYSTKEEKKYNRKLAYLKLYH